MSSTKAQQTYYGDLAEHRAAEGKKVRLKYKGDQIHCSKNIRRNAFSRSYVGAKNSKTYQKHHIYMLFQTTNEIYTGSENN